MTQERKQAIVTGLIRHCTADELSRIRSQIETELHRTAATFLITKQSSELRAECDETGGIEFQNRPLRCQRKTAASPVLSEMLDRSRLQGASGGLKPGKVERPDRKVRPFAFRLLCVRAVIEAGWSNHRDRARVNTRRPD